jgi:hypothetical protein
MRWISIHLFHHRPGTVQFLLIDRLLEKRSDYFFNQMNIKSAFTGGSLAVAGLTFFAANPLIDPGIALFNLQGFF